MSSLHIAGRLALFGRSGLASHLSIVIRGIFGFLNVELFYSDFYSTNLQTLLYRNLNEEARTVPILAI